MPQSWLEGSTRPQMPRPESPLSPRDEAFLVAKAFPGREQARAKGLSSSPSGAQTLTRRRPCRWRSRLPCTGFLGDAESRPYPLSSWVSWEAPGTLQPGSLCPGPSPSACSLHQLGLKPPACEMGVLCNPVLPSHGE